MTNANKANWTAPTSEPQIRTDELAQWKSAVQRITELAEKRGWAKVEAAKQLTIPEGTFSSWYSGKYGDNGKNTHNVTVKVLQGIEDILEAAKIDNNIKVSPPFIQMPTALKIQNALSYAQRSPEMVVVSAAAGCGKTSACDEYVKIKRNVHMFTMRPQTKSVHGMMTEVCRVLNVKQNNPAKLDSAIAEVLTRIGRNPLLIFDEAQNMDDLAVNQLRYFLDIHNCGIALVGSLNFYTKHAGLKDPQISRRIGMRIKQTRPTREDITALINGWEITDTKSRQLLAAIGEKEGALGQIDKTLSLASFLASAEGRELSADHIRAAWSNREAEV